MAWNSRNKKKKAGPRIRCSDIGPRTEESRKHVPLATHREGCGRSSDVAAHGELTEPVVGASMNWLGVSCTDCIDHGIPGIQEGSRMERQQGPKRASSSGPGAERGECAGCGLDVAMMGAVLAPAPTRTAISNWLAVNAGRGQQGKEQSWH